MSKDTNPQRSTEGYHQRDLENMGSGILDKFSQIRRERHARRIQYGKAEKKRQRDQTVKRLLESID